MTAKADFKKQWEGATPEARRARLDFLASNPERDEDQEREHMALAEMVAEDEDAARRERTAQQ